MRHRGTMGILRLHHILSLVFGEHLNDHKRTLPTSRVNEDLKVAARLDWLAVEVPRDLGLRVALIEDAEHGLVAVVGA